MRALQHHRAGYFPFGYKLLVTYAIFIIVPLIVIGIVSYSMYVESVRKQTQTTIHGTLQQIKDNIHYRINDVIRVSSTIYYDYNLADAIRYYEEGWETHEKTIKIVVPTLHNAITSTNLKIWASVFFHNETLPEIYHKTFMNEQPDESGRTYNIFHINRIKEQSWYQEHPVEQYSRTWAWRQVQSDADFGRISLLRRIVDIQQPLDMKEIGFVRISIKLSDLFESVDYAKIGDGSILTVRDRYGNTVYRSSASSAPDHARVNDETFMTIEEALDDGGWVLTASIPTMIVEQDAKRIRMFTIWVALSCLIVCTFAAIFISRHFSLRVNKLITILNAFREGDLHKRVQLRNKDEFSEIGNAINEMGENIGDLIKEVYVTQLQKKEAELESLQAQINPHFLYNTLSSISRLAKFGDTDRLHQMVMELAKFYRLTLNDGRTNIPLATELEQAQAYIEIQKIKFGERMDVLFLIDSDIWPYQTIKLIVQPFLENVFEHAWCGDRIHVRIEVQCLDEHIKIRIVDDGVGMTAERISHIFDSQDHVNGGYGIRNVHQRIRLQYGEQYGVSIFSHIGIGTVVEISIPAVRR
ncbi:cache domain-containing sensor histidine kinase [Paenibacillus arenosi]|uniref:histidine kinase n=1 Tax=Paenibacillus arenosi TaxID=2774142 RepID=A0ABR9AUY8_9BACL|nr:sensor histidine kinase [Paenibacillus arenosi]MBD8497832.1 sensor histidine kinase [Paenibacillus arenosi]